MSLISHPTRRLPFVAVWLMTLALAPATPTIASESDDAVLLQIMRDWQARRAAMARVHYVIKGTRLIRQGMMTEIVRQSEGKVSGEIPPRDDVADVSLDILIDFARNLRRADVVVPPLPGFDDTLNAMLSRQVYFNSRNGSETWYPNMSNEHVQLSVSAKGGWISLRPVWRPVYMGHGYVGTTTTGTGAPHRIRLEPTGLRVHTKLVKNGSSYAVLRFTRGTGSTPPWRELWIDLSKQSAVTRWTSYYDRTHRGFDMQIQYSRRAGGWLPRSWRMQRFDFDENETVLESWQLTVENLVPMPVVADDTFRKQQTPGMVVHDRATDKIYFVAADGTPGRDFRAHRRGKIVREVRGDARNSSRMRWVTILVVGLVITSGAGLHFILLRSKGR